ncbi:MAG: PLP-dependent aminotransferase family protein [Oscillospiraceae bacterium]|nr:PLP-dependent aminotransferase family protein [Oscillospiraceae bacterium]
MIFTVPFTKNGKPLYYQLYSYLVTEISCGGFAAGEKLPGKRTLAAHLRISQNTVETAYQMLVAEGYVTAKPRSGFYVCHLDKLSLPTESTLLMPQQPLVTPNWKYNLASATTDTGSFPFKTWSRISKDIMYNTPELLNHGPAQGDENLRQAIAKYLHEFRGVQCTAQQLVVGAGIEYLLGVLCQLFKRGTTIALENPGYPQTGRIIRNNRLNTVFVPVDAYGMDSEALAATNAQAVYLTPSHQYPTGATMPVTRRMALLQWAALQPGRYIIEDDYDSEFRFEGKPVPCLQGLDSDGCVIYLSTFSQSLAPSIRIAYMVLPPKLLLQYQTAFKGYASTVSRFEQQTLCGFINGGHFSRYVNRMRSIYKARRNFFIGALQKAFCAGRCTVLPGSTGMQLLVRITGPYTEQQLCKAAADMGILVRGLSFYRLDNTVLQDSKSTTHKTATLILSFSSLTETQLQDAVQQLAKAWHIENRLCTEH